MSDSAYVAALEKQNRLLRRLITICCGLLIVVTALGANAVTRSLIVQDELLVKDRNGVTRFEMVIHDGHGLSNGFHVIDANGKTRIDMGITPRGEPVLAFLDGNGRVIRTLP